MRASIKLIRQFSRAAFITALLLLASVPVLGQSSDLRGQHGKVREASIDVPVPRSTESYVEGNDTDSSTNESSEVPGQHTEVPEASVDEAFRIHARAYAKDVGMSLNEAQRRLQLQVIAGELRAQLMTHERDVINEVRIDHIPDFRVTIFVVPGGEERVRPYFIDGPLGDITTIEIVEYTKDQLHADLERANELLRPLGIPYAASIAENEAQIYVVGAEKFQGRLNEDGIVLPKTVKIYDVPYLDSTEGGR